MGFSSNYLGLGLYFGAGLVTLPVFGPKYIRPIRADYKYGYEPSFKYHYVSPIDLQVRHREAHIQARNRWMDEWMDGESNE